MGPKNAVAALAEFAKREYPDTKTDLFAMFIERCLELVRENGYVGMITMQSWMFLSSYQKLRKMLLRESSINSMAHLGARAFDSIGGEVVSTTAFVLHLGAEAAATEPGVFLRLVDGNSEAEKIKQLNAALDTQSKDGGYFIASASTFEAIPGTPIGYWLSEKMRSAFKKGKPLGEIAEPRGGMGAGSNALFVRNWWEVSKQRCAFDLPSGEAAVKSKARWFPYNKGGEYRLWYGNQEFLVNWENDGEAVKNYIVERYPYLNGNPGMKVRNTQFFFLPSISWSKISSGAPAFREYPQGFIFDVAGTSFFADSTSLRHDLISFTNSTVALEMLTALSPTLNFEVGQVGQLPIMPKIESSDIESNVKLLVNAARCDWDSVECSWEFKENDTIAINHSLP